MLTGGWEQHDVSHCTNSLRSCFIPNHHHINAFSASIVREPLASSIHAQTPIKRQAKGRWTPPALRLTWWSLITDPCGLWSTHWCPRLRDHTAKLPLASGIGSRNLDHVFSERIKSINWREEKGGYIHEMKIHSSPLVRSMDIRSFWM